jgi:hypothetical protein
VISGAYLLSGHDGPYAAERFTCGTVEGLWRYEGLREDPATRTPLGRLELEHGGGTVRLHAEVGGWVLRAAVAGGEVVWRRGEQEQTSAADGLTGSSPAFLVACARLGPGRLRLLEVTEPVLAVRAVLQDWARRPDEEHDGVAVQAWQVDDLSTGERRVVRLAGDVVVEAPGVRLTALTRT